MKYRLALAALFLRLDTWLQALASQFRRLAKRQVRIVESQLQAARLGKIK